MTLGDGDELAAGREARVPAARTADLVITESGGELLVYDQRSHHIHHLSAATAAVWRRCDGRRSIPDLAAAATAELGEAIGAGAVVLALNKLAEADLLAGTVPAVGASRRAFLRRAAKIGGAAIPAIVSVTAPLASASASGTCRSPVIAQSSCVHETRVGLCCTLLDPPYEGICVQATATSFECRPLRP